MAYTYCIAPADRLAHLTFTGTVTGHELGRALTALYEDLDWRAGYNTLWDFRAIRQLLLDPRDFQALARLDFAFMDRAGAGRDALLAARSLDLAMGRLFIHAARNAPRPSALFDAEPDARAWLTQAERYAYRMAA